MNPLILSRRQALGWLAATSCAALLPAQAAELPGDSIYQLKPPLTDQNGHAVELALGRGQPVLVTMFYSSCEMVCPMIFETIHMTLNALSAAEREHVKVLMISFDPARDSVPVLKQTAETRHCDAQWTLARTDDTNSRKIAALLGIQYRRLASGEFNHSSTIDLLDAQGRIAARSGMLGAVDPSLVAALRQALGSSH